MSSPGRSILALPLAALLCLAHAAGSAAQGDADLPAAHLRALELIRSGDYPEAERLARAELAGAEADGGETSLEAALAIDLLVQTLFTAGRAHELEVRQLAWRAVEIKEARLGPRHAGTMASLCNLGTVLRLSDKLLVAELLFQHVIDVLSERSGREHADVAHAQVELASVFLSQDRYAEAITLYRQALTTQKERLDRNDERVGKTLHNLGIAYHWSGDYDSGRSFLEDALAVAGWSSNDLRAARTWDALAILLSEVGEYDDAESLYRDALTVRIRRHGEQHRHVAWSLNNLATLLTHKGEYTEARRHLERALGISETLLGEDHPDTAMLHGNLADLFLRIGDTQRARAAFERALSIRRRALAEDRVEVAWSRYQLANVLAGTGDIDRARQLYQAALDSWKKNVGTRHRDYAMGLEGLANLQIERGDLAGARRMHVEALSIREETLGEDHPDVADSLLTLAALCRRERKPAEAEPLYARATEIRERSLGAAHPDVARALVDWAGLQLETGRLDDALATALRAESIAARHVRLTVRQLGERQALDYASSRASGQGVALSVIAQKTYARHAGKVWDAVLRSRALVLDEMAGRRRSFDTAASPDIARWAAALETASRRLANLFVRGPGPLSSEHYRSLMQDAARRKESAERELAHKSAEFRHRLDTEKLGLAQVLESLPSRAVLVAYVRYGTHGAADDAYLAFVASGPSSKIGVVSLGSAIEVDELVVRWREVSANTASAETDLDSEAWRAGEALRRLIWDPVVAHFAGATRVFIVPDGTLPLVSFAALPSDRGRYLVEAGPPIHYLSTERDLVDSSFAAPAGRGMLVIGGPEFDAASVRSAGRVGFRGERSACGDFQGLTFTPAPESIREAEAIGALWTARSTPGGDSDVTLLLGTEADEATFKHAAPGKRVLHIATHGFFLGARCPSSLARLRGVGKIVAGSFRPVVESAPENPFLLSGLALAGANRRNAAGPDDDDGILTAEEVATIDLRGVQWAVLSACDTGLGELEDGEGVLGLRRAFQVAGARTVIMSLWPVEDRATRLWMEALYDARLRRGLDTTQSVHHATRSILELRRARGLSTHPIYWAGFVACGDWR